MDYNLLITSLVVSLIFVSCVVLKCKYITKEKTNIKTIVLDGIIVLLITFVALNVLPMLTKKTSPKAFTEKPHF
jgi:hypothetical protein